MYLKQQIVHLKWVNYVVHELYLNKTIIIIFYLFKTNLLRSHPENTQFCSLKAPGENTTLLQREMDTNETSGGISVFFRVFHYQS